MIVGDKFVWLHFPKCAGTEVSQVLAGLRTTNPQLRLDDPRRVNVHDGLAHRMASQPDLPLRGKDVITCFRRLPYWMLSRIHFGYSRNAKYVPTRDQVLKGHVYEQEGHLSQADEYARKYAGEARFILRTEHVYDDFCAAFDRYLRFDPDAVKAAFTGRNPSPTRYIPDLSFWFTQDDLDRLYASAPYWARLEKHLYGDLLSL